MQILLILMNPPIRIEVHLLKSYCLSIILGYRKHRANDYLENLGPKIHNLNNWSDHPNQDGQLQGKYKPLLDQRPN